MRRSCCNMGDNTCSMSCADRRGAHQPRCGAGSMLDVLNNFLASLLCANLAVMPLLLGLLLHFRQTLLQNIERLIHGIHPCGPCEFIFGRLFMKVVCFDIYRTY